MEFVDRISTYPNRYAMTDEDGNVSYVILERADEPTVPGTPLNAETFNAMVADIEKVKMILGVDLGVTSTNNTTIVEVSDFDYFLVYTEENGRPIMCLADPGSRTKGSVTANHIDRMSPVKLEDVGPGYRLRISDYVVEVDSVSQTYGYRLNAVTFVKIVGYKYPPVKE